MPSTSPLCSAKPISANSPRRDRLLHLEQRLSAQTCPARRWHGRCPGRSSIGDAALVDLGDRPCAHLPAVPHDGDALGDLHDLVQPVRDEDHGDPVCLASATTIANSRSTSARVSEAVGSSMKINRAFAASPRAMATIWRSATDRSETMASRSRSKSRRSSTSRAIWRMSPLRTGLSGWSRWFSIAMFSATERLGKGTGLGRSPGCQGPLHALDPALRPYGLQSRSCRRLVDAPRRPS